ncbi:MAG: hypothetical protein KDD50_09135 [Bdellovibrionales bacterium]|nr:hypothetical protein [Bdellovibrionales bacterium]
MSNSYAFELSEDLNLPLKTLNRIDSVLNKSLSEPINCWGVALWSQGYIGEIRPSFKTEVMHIFEQNRCKKLSADEPPRTGDFGSFFNSESGIYHTFVHIKDSWIFEKGSPQTTDVPLIVNVDKKFEGYPISFDLKTGCKFGSDTECKWGIVNYRCDLHNQIVQTTTEQGESLQKLFSKIIHCSKPENRCESEFPVAFKDYIMILNRALVSPENLTSNEFQAIGKILVFLNKNRDSLGHLPPEMLEAFLQLTDAITMIENDTFKTLADFPDFSQHAR